MSKPHVLMLGGNEAVRARLAEVFEVHSGDLDAILASHGDRIEYVLAMYSGKVDAALMDRLPKLKAISNHGVGYDAIDTQAAVTRGIVVTHTPDVLNDEVANTTILLLLACARQFLRDEDYVRSGRWEVEGTAPLTRSVRGSTVGIVGMGRIGQAIAEKLSAFGTHIAYHTRSEKDVPYPYYADLTALAEASDYLVVIIPGGAATKHLINEEVINALGPNGTLINVARGSVVDEPALIKALQDGRLGFAGLDVFEQEPHVPAELRALKNTVLLPHVGSATVETRTAMGNLACDNLISMHQTGKAMTPVPECRDL